MVCHWSETEARGQGIRHWRTIRDLSKVYKLPGYCR